MSRVVQRSRLAHLTIVAHASPLATTAVADAEHEPELGYVMDYEQLPSEAKQRRLWRRISRVGRR